MFDFGSSSGWSLWTTRQDSSSSSSRDQHLRSGSTEWTTATARFTIHWEHVQHCSHKQIVIFLDDSKQSCRATVTATVTAMGTATASMVTPSLRTVKAKVMAKRYNFLSPKSSSLVLEVSTGEGLGRLIQTERLLSRISLFKLPILCIQVEPVSASLVLRVVSDTPSPSVSR